MCEQKACTKWKIIWSSITTTKMGPDLVLFFIAEVVHLFYHLIRGYNTLKHKLIYRNGLYLARRTIPGCYCRRVRHRCFLLVLFIRTMHRTLILEGCVDLIIIDLANPFDTPSFFSFLFLSYTFNL